MRNDSRPLLVSYDGGNRITSITDPIGRAVRYSYDGSGRLAVVMDATFGETRYTYDNARRMLTITDARGILFLAGENGVRLDNNRSAAELNMTVAFMEERMAPSPWPSPSVGRGEWGKVTIVAGQANMLGFTPHLHFQKTTGLVDISNSAVERVVTDPEIPGFAMTIPAGATITGWDGQPNTHISVRRVPTDRVPLPPMPADRYSPIVYMDYFGKPGGGTPSEPIPITGPNDLGVPPGTQVELWYFDEAPDGSRPNQWAQYGTGTVSADGSQVVPDLDPTTGKPYGQPRFCCGAWRLAALRAAVQSLLNGTPTSPGGTKGGDPVDVATGNFGLEKTDVVLPGRLPVTVTRTYRTNGSSAGPFGPGTSHSQNALLLVQSDLRTLVLPDGKRVAFPK